MSDRHSHLSTLRDKYTNDPAYRQLVDVLENLIERAQFTPSELREVREAAILACINYEMRRVRGVTKYAPQT